MFVQGFPYCCGAALFYSLYDSITGSYGSYATLGPLIQQFKKEGAITSKNPAYAAAKMNEIGGNIPRTVDGHTRRVAIAITNDHEIGQEKVLLDTGAKHVATFKGNTNTPLKVWIIPLIEGDGPNIQLAKEEQGKKE